MGPEPPNVEGPPARHADHRQLRQILAGLREGVLLVDPDQTIAWANRAALDMHGVATREELGGTVEAYRERFELRYRNGTVELAGDGLCAGGRPATGRA